MPIPPFIEGYPPDGSSLGQTKQTIRNNLDGTFQTLAVDHIDNNGVPGSNPAGYHRIIHQVPQSAVTTVAGYSQLFSAIPGNSTVDGTALPNIPPTAAGGPAQLYSLTGPGSGNGTLSQLTGHVGATNGYQWVGGILIQWGFAQLQGTSTERRNINFNTNNVNFPHNAFSVQLTLVCQNSGTSSNQNTLSVCENTLTTTQFIFQFSGNGAVFTGFYWLAIGN